MLAEFVDDPISTSRYIMHLQKIVLIVYSIILSNLTRNNILVTKNEFTMLIVTYESSTSTPSMSGCVL